MESNIAAGALNVATTAARTAGAIINQSIEKLDRVKVSQKSVTEFVTEIDIYAEQTIIQEIENSFPEHSILGEESGKLDKKSDFCWIVDSLDGTGNYIHGHPHCCVSIALKNENDVIMAVVYDPFRNELFSAIKGGGAQMDGRRMRVSGKSRLSDSLLCTGFPYRHASQTKPWLKSFATLLPRAQGIHRTGSSVLDFAYVACGRYDGFWEFGMKEWEIAAGSLLVTEAGGLIRDARGGDDIFATGDIVAGTPKVFEKLQHIVSQTVFAK